MNTYTIRIKVDIVPSTELATNEPVEQDDGSVRMTLTELEAISIDTCEQAVLKTAYPTLRKALSTHLRDVSRQHAMAHQREGQEVKTSWAGRVDGEIGRFEFVRYQLFQGYTPVDDTTNTLFPGLRRWEWYKTSGFKELAFIYGVTEESYHKTSRLLNRIRYQPEDGTPSRTLREQTDVEGTKLAHAIEHKAEQVLKTHEFRADGIFEGTPDTYQGQAPVSLSEEQVTEAIAICQARVKEDCDLRENPVPYESPEETVNLSVDDVGVKRQKATRECQSHDVEEAEGEKEVKKEIKKEVKKGVKKEVKKEVKKKIRKYVHQTVVHIEKAGHSYLINGRGIKHVLSLVIAVLLNSDLLRYRLQFFTDGYGILHDAIHWCFSWYPNLGILLDWYHLEEKCKIQLSSAMTGRTVRNEVLSALCPLLWNGLVDHAIAYVNSLPPSQIKNPEALKKLLGYFERNRGYIPCYAVRKELGLRNSSQIGEKMNDLVVSARQKHNGMSWSISGSVALASLTVLARNDEYARWFEEGDIEFKLAA